MVEVKDALRGFAAAINTLAEGQQKGRRVAEDRRASHHLDSSSEKSGEEEESEEEHRRGVNKHSRTSRKGLKTSPAPRTPKKRREYYAVARGRVPGVYTNWSQAEKQVNGFSGSLHKKFKDRASAQKFVDANRAESDGDSGTESGSSGSDTEETPKEPKRITKGRGQETRTERKLARNEPGYPPVELGAPDPSIGNPKELFKMTIEGDQRMTEKLSPPGVDAKTMKALADATLDAIQLPGTSITESMESTSKLVGAIREMTDDRRNDWTEERAP